jgi:hypothetical protein
MRWGLTIAAVAVLCLPHPSAAASRAFSSTLSKTPMHGLPHGTTRRISFIATYLIAAVVLSASDVLGQCRASNVVMVPVVPVILCLINTAIGSPGTSRSLQAYNEGPIYHEGLGPESFLVARYPTLRTVSSISTSTCYLSTTALDRSIEPAASSRAIMPSTRTTSFHTPLSFGTNRTAITNATSAHLHPTGTVSSWSSATGSSAPSSRPFTGMAIRPDVTWSHVFLWAAIIEIAIGILS